MSNWEDTVMSKEESMSAIPQEVFQLIVQKMGKDADVVGAALYANDTKQAEISFKAGREDRRAEYVGQVIHLGSIHKEITRKLMKESMQAGIKEVVEWVNKNMYKQGSIEKWQAQVKEWGIQNES